MSQQSSLKNLNETISERLQGLNLEYPSIFQKLQQMNKSYWPYKGLWGAMIVFICTVTLGATIQNSSRHNSVSRLCPSVSVCVS